MLRDLFRRKTIAMILSHAETPGKENSVMRRNLSVRDLTALGIAAIVGAGIFSTIGTAAANGGPAVSLLFVFTAMACGFTAMCYAEFASSIPISGSAYTYAYASFGELIAWIIGWDLIMEYAVGNIAVAISWSGYFTGLMSGLGVHIPEFLCIDYLSAARGFREASSLIAGGLPFEKLNGGLQESWLAWQNAPIIGGVRLVADIPAFGIVVFITWLVYKGIYETKVAGNIMVILKLAILMLVIGVGSFYVDPKNWSPFAPNGVVGVLKGVSGVFFAYIGFDAISTTAEECKNPKRDLPRAMIYALVITTVLYVLISLVLTGMVPSSELGVADPLAFAFSRLHLTRLSGVIAVSAIIAMASVLLVFQVGQPRIWMSMSRDGLLPPRFSRLHPRYKTPGFSTIITGIMVAIPSLFLNLTEVTDLTSIGTLFAFVLVSGGILLLNHGKKSIRSDGAFKVPYFNSRFYLPVIWIIVAITWIVSEYWYSGGSHVNLIGDDLFTLKGIMPHLALLIYLVLAAALTLVSMVYKWSLIPVLGLLTNLYLMSELGITNWLRFIIWLAIGLLLYFTYGSTHSRLRTAAHAKL
ncbi:MAG: amino acid permease [Bacteroidales bacterium]